MLVRTSLRPVSTGPVPALLALPGEAPRNDAPPDEGTTVLISAGLKRFPFERTQDACHSLSSVIAGLDPAIHLLLRKKRLAKKMDPRVKPAGDARECKR